MSPPPPPPPAPPPSPPPPQLFNAADTCPFVCSAAVAAPCPCYYRPCAGGRVLHSSTSQLNLIRFRHKMNSKQPLTPPNTRPHIP